MWSLLMGNSYSSDETDNLEHSENNDNVEHNKTIKDIHDLTKNDVQNLDNKMNTKLATSEATVKLGLFNQPLKITKIQSRKESIDEVATICDNERPSLHVIKRNQIESGKCLTLFNKSTMVWNFSY